MFGFDFGGSLTKVAYISPDGKFHFDLFRTTKENIERYFTAQDGSCLAKFAPEPLKNWAVVGAGSWKFSKFLDTITPPAVKGDEMKAASKGVEVVLDRGLEIRTYGGSGKIGARYIIASMGTGVSFTAVERGKDVRHIGGSAIGGGTLMALARLILNVTDFQQLCKIAATGNASSLDLLIKDIVGEDYGDGPLKMDVVASSMAKAAWMEERPPDADIAASIIATVSFSIGAHVASLCAAEKIDTVIFVGGFLDMDGLIAYNLQRSVNLFHPEITIAIPKDHHFMGAIGAATQANLSKQ